MQIIKIILSVIFIIDCIALTVVVLMQEGKQQGLGAIAGAAETYWGKNKGRSMEGGLVLFHKALSPVPFKFFGSLPVSEAFKTPRTYKPCVFAQLLLNFKESVAAVAYGAFPYRAGVYTYRVIGNSRSLAPAVRGQ